MNANICRIVNSYYLVRLRKINQDGPYDDFDKVHYKGNVYSIIDGNIYINDVCEICSSSAIYSMIRKEDLLYAIAINAMIIYKITENGLNIVNRIVPCTSIGNFVINKAEKIFCTTWSGIEDTITKRIFKGYFLMRTKIVSNHSKNVIELYDINEDKSDFIAYKNSFDIKGLDILVIDGKYYEVLVNEN